MTSGSKGREEMAYKVKEEIKVLSVGLTVPKGGTVGEGQLPQSVLQKLIAEGIAVPLDSLPKAPPPPEPEVVVEEGDGLEDLSLEELKEIARGMKIKGWQLAKKPETLIKRIREAGG